MEAWLILVITICISALLKPLLSFLNPTRPHLPPGPTSLPILGNLLWLQKPLSDIEQILQTLKLKYGPIITLKIGSRTSIFINSHTLAHTALVENGAVFADRPSPPPTSKFLSCDQHNITSAGYGATWRLFRRNLSSEILHPSRVKAFSHAREWVLNVLLHRLSGGVEEKVGVRVVDDFQFAMFGLLVLMCFGDKLEEKEIKEIQRVERGLLLSLRRFSVLDFWPKLGKVLFYRRWSELKELRRNQENVLIPLIKSRLEKLQSGFDQEEGVTAYVDTLLKLKLPEEGDRKLSFNEIVGLCSEFLNAGTDTTTTALQWIMANLVKYPEIQRKVYDEIVRVKGKCPGLVGDGKMVVVEEEDLQQMPYLKSVVLETLRVHPPGHFVLAHSVTKEVEFDGYVIPKDARINFMVAEMGRDQKVWDDPMEFKPERFLTKNGDLDAFDITGSRGIKMMPFGVGRRICPGLNLALLHLEYFVANLVWYSEWKAPDGVPVDLSEKPEFTVVMKYPLLAHISPRAEM
ncbi:p450 domain-containing protein [Heracleum sosnowskyi]|uniref:P450 domain-containing protein n=1 Tax=Heracleum sosnowskyi TaxID=360622 RepID=A0AAD8JDH3_9APIA|nr:p450 domain-containing protein [Heracleum sosnowskyi]